MKFCLYIELDNELLLRPLFGFYNLLTRNAYVLTYKEGEKHHYIPQFLLRNFSILNTSNIYEYTYKKTTRAVSIEKQAAFIPNLYSFKDRKTKQQSDFIEKQIFAHTLEKFTSRFLNKIIKNENAKLTFLEESILVSFVGFQYIRTPKFFAQVTEVLEYLYLDRGISLEEMLESNFYKEVFFENKYLITPQKLVKFGLQNKRKVQGVKNIILGIALRIGGDLGSIIYRGNFYWIKANPPAFFYLSDNPVEMYNLIQKRNIGPFLWELKDDSLIYIPISPDTCLYYLKSGMDIPAHVVGGIMEHSTGESVYEFAYSDRNSPKISALFK